MSETLIGYVEKDCVYMAADSAVGDGSLTAGRSPENIGVFSVPSGILCGFHGQRDVQNLLMAYPEWLDLSRKEKRKVSDAFGKTHTETVRTEGELDMDFLMNRFLPQFYRGLKEYNLLHDSNGESIFYGDLLLAKGNRLYSMNSRFYVRRVNRYAVLSYMPELVIPFLHVGGPHETPESLLSCALELAAGKNRKTVLPCRLFSTKDPEGRIAEVHNGCIA